MGEGSISFGGESVNRTVMQDAIGCATTLGEIIEYYQRDDILSLLISRSSKGMKAGIGQYITVFIAPSTIISRPRDIHLFHYG